MSKALAVLAFLAAASAGWAIDEKEADEAIDRFKKSYADPSPALRATAVAELSKAVHEKVAKRLIGVAGSGDVEEVRVAAVTGLGGFTDHKKLVTPVLVSLLSSDKKQLKVSEAAFKSLGKLDAEDALGNIHRFFDEDEVSIASAALMAAAEIKHLSSIDLIIELMKKYEKETKGGGSGGGSGNIAPGFKLPGNVPGGSGGKASVAKAVLPVTIKAMQTITGEKYATAADWQIWWGRRKATYKITK